MQSPPAEWCLGIAYLAVLDVIRDRGEPDGDTLSEVTRDLFRVDTDRGRAAFTASLIGGGVVLWRHICK